MFEFPRQDLPHINVRTAVANVYRDLFSSACSSYPWFQNPSFLSLSQKIGEYWQSWENSMLDLLSSSAGRPISLKLQQDNSFSPDQLLLLDEFIGRSADINPGNRLIELLSNSKYDFPEYLQVALKPSPSPLSTEPLCSGGPRGFGEFNSWMF